MLQDLQFAIRLLVKDKWFTLVATLALALGIGVNATVFTFVNAVLIRGLPVDDPDRVMALNSRDTVRDRQMGVSYLGLHRLAQRHQELLGTGRLQLLGDEPQRGRPGAGAVQRHLHLRQRLPDPRPDADRSDAISSPKTIVPGAPPVVLLGGGVWKSRYGGNPSVIGQTVRVNDVPSVIIGVMPEGFKFPQNADLWQPLALIRDLDQHEAQRAQRSRSSAGSPPASRCSRRRRRCSAIGQRLAADYPDTNKDIQPNIQTFNERFNNGPDPRGVPVAHGRGRLRAADCLRQRREPAAGALGAAIA